MVAASLEVAHEKVIEKLPTYPTHTPIGWRFMDKFIQLPVIIPPVTNMETYIQSLFSQQVVADDPKQNLEPRVKEEVKHLKNDNVNIYESNKKEEYKLEGMSEAKKILLEIFLTNYKNYQIRIRSLLTKYPLQFLIFLSILEI
jgi:hypothetical protein